MPPQKPPGTPPMVITSDTHWTIDKRIPVAVIVAFGAQLLAAVIYASQMHSMLQDHDRRLAMIEAKDRADDQRANEMDKAVVRLQEATISLREAIVDLRRATPSAR